MLDEVVRRYGVESAAWAFAAHWSSDWLQRAIRLAPAPVRPASVVIGDAARDELDPDMPYIRALELFCARAGIGVLSLSVRGVAGIGDAVAVHRPNVVIVAGSHLGDDTVARWAYAIRLSAGPVPLAVYRRGEPARGANATRLLPTDPRGAQERILELIGTDMVALPAARREPDPRARTEHRAAADQRRAGQKARTAITARADPRIERRWPPHTDPSPHAPRFPSSSSRSCNAGASATCSPSRCAVARAHLAGVFPGPADRQRPARVPPRAQPSVQGHLPAVSDDDRPLRRAQGRLGLPRAAGRAGARSRARVESKADIEAFGIAEFNARCRQKVLSHVDEWNRLTERIGFWVDLDDAYRRLDATRRVGAGGR